MPVINGNQLYLSSGVKYFFISEEDWSYINKAGYSGWKMRTSVVNQE